ncbi:EpsG family protein [Salegentibacter sp. T436]|uniref:EpsG family protein n=1 Tax=Salegentibacter sp. T436 TaxID=1729720 RepID=UPI00094A5DC1|nr:EpsG family protein [Salegentibacter sp. T436]APS37430.1 hypothetical protein AO058_00360 [Salegentibacter sp. T436]
MIYFLNSLLLSIVSFTDLDKNHRKNGKLLLFFLCGFLVLFASLRDNVGLDDIGYKEYFEATNSLDEVIFEGENLSSDKTNLVEPLFLLMASVGKIITEEVFILFFICATIALFIRYKIFWKYSPYPILSLLIYASHEFYVKDWTQIRAGLASVIILYGIKFLFSGKDKKFIITVIIAAGFHYIAVIAIPLLFLRNLKNPKKFYSRALLLAAGISLLIPFKATLIQLSEYGLIPYRISQYFYYQKYAFEMAITDIIIIKGVILSLISIYYYNRLASKYSFYSIILSYQVLATIYLLVFRDFSIMAVRANGLLYVVEPILIILLLNQIKQKGFVFMGAFLYSFLWIFYDQFLNPFGLPVYKTILE